MPKAKKVKIDPQEQIRQLQAESARQKAHIDTLEKAARKRKHREMLIPRPKGQAGRSVEHGGYNLQTVIGLDGDDERYNRLHRMVKRYIHENLSVFHSLRDQESGRVRKMILVVKKEIPFFQDFEQGWPIRDMARVYLSNEQTRRRKDEEAESKAEPAAVSSGEEEPARKKAKTARFAESEDEDADDELVAAVPKKKKAAGKPTRPAESDNDHDETSSKTIVNKRVKRTAASRTVLSDSDSEGANVKTSKSKGTKQAAKPKAVSSDENDSDDAQDLKKLIGRSGALKPTNKPTNTTVKKAKEAPAKNPKAVGHIFFETTADPDKKCCYKGGSDLDFPYSVFGADEEYSPWEFDEEDALVPSKPGKENNASPKTNKRKSVSSLAASPTKKSKTETVPRQNIPTSPPSKQISKKPVSASAGSASDDDDRDSLTWEDLPKACPATMCSDRLPSIPVPRILALFNRFKILTDANGPSAKGAALVQLEICQAITLEKRRKTISRLGEQRRWPKAIQWDDILYRMAAFKEDIYQLLKDIWQSFLLDINYEIIEFSESRSKLEYKPALLGKRCGYYGPQGEFVIYSSLLRLLSEFDEDSQALEIELSFTLHSLVVGGADRDQFAYDDDQITAANYLCLDDFIRFILVPFVASSLILEDQPSLLTLQGAIFEKMNSQEYGELMFPEIQAKAVDRLHQQNILATNSNKEAKVDRIIEREKARSAPPKHRKHSDDNPGPLKICLPLPKKSLEQEITLDDFPPPSPSKQKQKPKPKPKKNPAREQVKEVKTNSKGQKVKDADDADLSLPSIAVDCKLVTVPCINYSAVYQRSVADPDERVFGSHPFSRAALKYTLSRRFGPHIAPHRPLNEEIRDFHDIHQEGRILIDPIERPDASKPHPDPAYAVRIGYKRRRDIPMDSKPSSPCRPRRQEGPLRAWVYYESVPVDKTSTPRPAPSAFAACSSVRTDGISRIRGRINGQRLRGAAPALISAVLAAIQRRQKILTRTPVQAGASPDDSTGRPLGARGPPLRAHRPTAARRPHVGLGVSSDCPELHYALR
ncbi:hypothetical protein DFH06DRAFT_1365968 [Mycena polygramma]|nr:hypothetical protein DFH06DRAFT_1365968 [Mycena polygramma]